MLREVYLSEFGIFGIKFLDYFSVAIFINFAFFEKFLDSFGLACIEVLSQKLFLNFTLILHCQSFSLSTFQHFNNLASMTLALLDGYHGFHFAIFEAKFIEKIEIILI